MGLGPFGRADETGLLRVPARVDEGPLRLPARLREGSDRLRLGHDRNVARKGIPGAENPAVVVVPADDPLVRIGGALHDGDHVVDRLQAPVGRDREVRLRRPRSDVVGERQGAPPARRGHGALERGEKRLRIPVGDRDHRNLEEGLCIADRKALRILRGSHARGQRVARILRDVGHRAALDPVLGAIAALRVDVSRPVSVLVRVGVDDAPDRAVLLRQLGLEPAPALAVARDRDLSADVEPAPIELGIILGSPEIHIDQVRGDIAVRTVDIVRGKAPCGMRRGLVAVDGGFGEERLVRGGRNELKRHALRRRVEDAELLDVRVPPPFLELRERELRVRLVVGRADLVRLRRHLLQPRAELRGIDRRVKQLFLLKLGDRRCRLESRGVVGRHERDRPQERRARQHRTDRSNRFHGWRKAAAPTEGKRPRRRR